MPWVGRLVIFVYAHNDTRLLYLLDNDDHDAPLGAALYGPCARGRHVYNDQIDAACDFVIAGGGLAGLVLASRLSEDTNTTVLVLEVSALGDAVKPRIVESQSMCMT